MLQRIFPYGPAKKVEPQKVGKIGSYMPSDEYRDHIGGYRYSQRVFANMEQKLGMSLFIGHELFSLL